MKTFFFSFLLSSLLWANPIQNNPNARFSELKFDSNNHWTLELMFLDRDTLLLIDSITIKANNIITKLDVIILNSAKFLVITEDSLSIPLLLNRTGGKIFISTYFTMESRQVFFEDSVSWGNDPDATIDMPLEGQSICRFPGELRENDWQIDYLTDHPSFGLPNDTTGATAILSGILYDMYNNPVTKIQNGGYYFQFESDLILSPDGSFTTRLFNTRYNPGNLHIKMYDFQGLDQVLKMDTIYLPNFQPNSLVTKDFHINEYSNIIITDVENEIPVNYDIDFINYPNPFNSTTNFVVKIPDGFKWNEMDIMIYNSSGQLVKNISINGSCEISWNGTDTRGNILPSGAYYYSLNADHSPLKNGSMILLK